MRGHLRLGFADHGVGIERASAQRVEDDVVGEQPVKLPRELTSDDPVPHLDDLLDHEPCACCRLSPLGRSCGEVNAWRSMTGTARRCMADSGIQTREAIGWS
jgi:hypothetical protein